MRRRTLLQWMISAAAVGFGGLVPLLLRLRRVGEAGRSSHPDPGGSPGPLDDRTSRWLQLSAQALLGVPVLRGHYATYYQWHAEHSPGYRELYRRFTTAIEKRAKRAAIDFESG